MKCPYCGGEVSSQSVECPFCGRENPEGIAFQTKVQEKIERNKLLKPFLIKQKTPELASRMLTRMLSIMAVVNIGILGISFLIFLWMEREPNRKPAEGSYAEIYYEQIEEIEDYYYESYYRNVIDFLKYLDDGKMPDDYEIESLISSAHRALQNSQEKEYYSDIYMHEKAFFEGVLGLTEEESAFLEPNEKGEYRYLQSGDIRYQVATEAVKRKMKEGK